MKKLKDFFYDKNDIIIVLIILAVAALIIYTRIGAIMDYPEKLAKQTATAAAEEEATDITESSVASITIEKSDTVDAVSQKLYDEKLITSEEDFTSYIENLEDEVTFKEGTFQIPKDSSNEEISDIITN